MQQHSSLHTEKLFYQLVYTARVFELTHRLYPLFGRGFFNRFASAVARCYCAAHPEVVETVRKNLGLLSTDAATPCAAREVFRNFALVISDYIAVGSMRREKALALCFGRTGVEHLSAEARGGKGAILATPHFGFFEYGALVLSELGIPLSIVTLPEPSTSLSEWRARQRLEWGAETITIGHDAFHAIELVRALDAGRCVAMLVDRPSGSRSVPVRLPNGTIPFSHVPALLAHLSGCPIIPVCVRRRPDGAYHLLAKPGVTPRPRESGDEGMRRMTQQMAESLLAEIQATPTQWFQFAPL